MWLDANDQDSLVLRGDTVVQWKDKSGLNNNATSVNNPTIQKGAILLNGQGQHFTTNYSAHLPAETSFIVYSVANQNQVSLIESGAARGRQFMNNGGGGVGPSLANNAIVWLATGKLPTALNTQYLGECVYNQSGMSLYLNGKLSLSNSTNPNFTDGLTTIGGSPSQRDYYLAGTISEVIIYNSVLSTEDRQNVESYLASKWNLSMSN